MDTQPNTTRTRIPKIHIYKMMLGCDPEIFISKKGRIIGAEKVIPEKGIGKHEGNKVIIDGVQAEINPQPSSCREILSGNIRNCLLSLHEELQKNKDIKIDFSQTITVSKREIKSLSKKNQVFGCSPSKNAYDKKNEISVRDASTYPYRSAGGHIHLGVMEVSSYPGENRERGIQINDALTKHRDRTVRMLDVLLGNTCVLIDRDPGNIERRKVYGKAGEYREPKHGLEYRTLSNFWLRDYALFSFVTGMARFAVNVIAETERTKVDYEKMIMKKVNMTKIMRAINENDADLARNNFRRIAPVLRKISSEQYGATLDNKNIKLFMYFVQKGMDHWFKNNPIDHWVKMGTEGNRRIGWENFIQQVVKPDYERSLLKKTK